MSDQKLSRQAGTILSPYPSSPQAAGMIIAFAGSSAPSGWAICDGSEVSIASYEQLFARIGTTWNNARNQALGSNWANPISGNFRLPDLRGTFLRSAGTSNGYGATTLGSTQDDATAINNISVGADNVTTNRTVSQTNDGAHTHTITDPGHSHSQQATYAQTGAGCFGGSPGGGNTAVGINSSTTGITINSASSGHNHSPYMTAAEFEHSHSISSSDTETRPVNVGVNYLIKLYDDSGSIIMSGSPFIGSEFRPSPISISGNNSLSLDKFYTINSSSPSTQTLPAAIGSGGVITVENVGTGLVTVDGNGSETINGVANQILGQYQSLKVRDYAAGQWIIMH